MNSDVYAMHLFPLCRRKRWEEMVSRKKKKKYTVRRDEYLQKLVAMLYKLYICCHVSHSWRYTG